MGKLSNAVNWVKKNPKLILEGIEAISLISKGISDKSTEIEYEELIADMAVKHETETKDMMVNSIVIVVGTIIACMGFMGIFGCITNGWFLFSMACVAIVAGLLCYLNAQVINKRNGLYASVAYLLLAVCVLIIGLV